MKRTDFWKMHQVLHKEAVQELKTVLRAFGGKVVFARYEDDDTQVEPNVKDYRPTILVNTKYNGPQDFYVNSVELVNGNYLTILGEPVEDYEGESRILTDDIEFGHVSYITDLIPDKADQGESSLIKTAEFKFLGGEWACIHINEHDGAWEFQSNEDDEETYSEGMFETDWENGRPLTVTGYDGCYDLPLAVKEGLRLCGFALEL